MCLGLLREQWDVAIILDACRYDVFKEVYKQYLPKGKLVTRVGGSDTLDWLHSVFNGYGKYDIVYVSAHPGINGKGVAWGSFNGSEKFYKVYDAWINGWDWEIGSSLPDEVAKIAVEIISENPDRKILIHFLQPHFPYRKAPCPCTYSDLKGVKNSPKFGLLLERVLRNIIQILGANFSPLRVATWKLKKILNLNFLEDLAEIYWREYAVSDLRHFYKDNLEWVLESTVKIIEEFNDLKIVVTSDHGEAFGEHGEFFHLYKTNNPVVRLVPFWQNTA